MFSFDYTGVVISRDVTEYVRRTDIPECKSRLVAISSSSLELY
jgi:hypothetical protein